MSIDASESIIVLLHGNNYPMHDGHRELFKFAKTIGDKVVAVVMRNVMEWYYFLRTGTAHPITLTETAELVKSIEEIGVPVIFQDFDNVSEDTRKAAMDKAIDVIHKYREEIIVKRVGEICQMMLADILLRPALGEKARVKGPDLEAFVLKDVMKQGLIGMKSSVHIMPSMVRSSDTGLKTKRDKDDGFLNPAQKSLLPKIGELLKTVRQYYEKGWNGPLVERLNSRYEKMQQGAWKFYEIVVFEGGIFENYRLEFTSFAFPTENGGVSLFEDWNTVQKL